MGAIVVIGLLAGLFVAIAAARTGLPELWWNLVAGPALNLAGATAATLAIQRIGPIILARLPWANVYVVASAVGALRVGLPLVAQ